MRAAHGSGSQRLYSFRDILVLKVVKRLLDTGISLQQIRAAVDHLRDRGTSDLARLTLMSDGVSVYECTSADEVVDLLAGGQGVFGIALGRIWQEVDGTLAELPGRTGRAARGTASRRRRDGRPRRAGPAPGQADGLTAVQPNRLCGKVPACLRPSASGTSESPTGICAAVDGVTFEVAHGEFFGILGPNGAGKTTTLEIIEGLREADGGEVSVLGLPPWPRNPALLPRIGVQLQASSFFERLTAREQIRTFADAVRGPGASAPTRCSRWSA